MKIKMFSRIKLRLVIIFVLLSQIIFTLSKPQKKKIKLLLNQNFLVQDEEIKKNFSDNLTTLLPFKNKKINSTSVNLKSKITKTNKNIAATKLPTKSIPNLTTSSLIIDTNLVTNSKLLNDSISTKTLELTTNSYKQIEENVKEQNNQTMNSKRTNSFIEDQIEVTVSTMVKILNENTSKNLNNVKRVLSRDQWLAKEYFSYLCASDFCVNSETKDRILNSCFTKHEQLNQLINKCLIKGRCESQIQAFNCVLNEKDSLLIPWIPIHDCVDGLVSMRTWKCIRREQLMGTN